MSDTKAAFEAAVANSKLLTTKPDNATLLKIYSLYKQATLGDVSGERPDFDFVGAAKYDAWEALRGTSAEAAMTDYVAVIEGLRG
jgi:diazepam-binding inhibitor (GABA receptor modulator, acyl-CoA-binding protein)